MRSLLRRARLKPSLNKSWKIWWRSRCSSRLRKSRVPRASRVGWRETSLTLVTQCVRTQRNHTRAIQGNRWCSCKMSQRAIQTQIARILRWMRKNSEIFWNSKLAILIGNGVSRLLQKAGLILMYWVWREARPLLEGNERVEEIVHFHLKKCRIPLLLNLSMRALLFKVTLRLLLRKKARKAQVVTLMIYPDRTRLTCSCLSRSSLDRRWRMWSMRSTMERGVMRRQKN